MRAVKPIKQEYTYRASWIQLVRPLTLTGSLSPALAATGLAARTGEVRFGLFIVFLLAALLVQMAVNILNDYFDFKKGQDKEKWETKSNSGPAYRSLPKAAGVMLAVSAVLGIWLAVSSSGWIFFSGAVGVTGGIFYSAGKRPLSSLGLGELVAAIFLGFAVTILAYAVQDAPLGFSVFAVALPYAFLIASMILTNNIRDMEKDKNFRRTIPIRIGRRRAVRLLTCLLVFPYLWLFLLTVTETIPVVSLLALLAVPYAVKLRHHLRKDAAGTEVMAAMKLSALHHWAFGLLFAAGIWLG